MTDVKFCGMTRDDDVREAARLGAAFVGVIMTKSSRRVAPDRARDLFALLDGTTVRRVGVFGDEPFDEILAATRLAACDIVQLHGGPSTARELPSQLRAELGVDVWRVVRFGTEGVPVDLPWEWSDVDGLLLDTMVAGASGGTGTPFDWARAALQVRGRRAGQRLIVAGGLRPENVRLAIDRLGPDVVDVSSGVESVPGVKDHRRMAAFVSAVRQDAPSSVS